MKTSSRLLSLGLLCACSVSALADTIVVDSKTVAGAAGMATGKSSDGTGIPAVSISVPQATYYTFSVTGTVSPNSQGPGSFFGGDGYPFPENLNAFGPISGINANTHVFLAGVFAAADAGSGAPPPSLDFTTGAGIGFSSLSPALNQLFFIGDGLTGTGTGASQTFFVPAGADTLYLGISDGCGDTFGPSCYQDNQGSFTVSYTATPTPEPSSLALLGTGVLGVAGFARRRFMKAC